MRTVVIILATLLFLAVGFGVYFYAQSGVTPSVAAGNQVLPAPGVLQPGESVSSLKVQQGENVWMIRYDEKTGAKASEFRAAHYDPQKDGSVKVDKPEGWFYLSKGQRLRIEGKDGDVVMPDNGGKNSALAGRQAALPSRGQLRDVKIKLYESDKDRELDRPSLIATLNNASFDNDTFRIYSEGFTGADGKFVPADQVPVMVRGVDYDFDGKGLTIRWNERDRHLQLLEIAHGERLVVKHPSKMAMPMASPAKTTAPTTNHAARIDETDNVQLAAADKKSAIKAIPHATTRPTTRSKPRRTLPKPKIVPNSDRILYRATFYENVRVTQGDQGTITGDVMHIDFLSENTRQNLEQSTTAPTTAPTVTPSTAPADNDVAATTPTTSPSEDEEAQDESVPTTSPTATTQPGQQPITINWTGKLQVAPLDSTGDDGPLESGDAIVRMTGVPLLITRPDSHIECASLRYDTHGSHLFLQESPAVRLTMSGPNHETVTASSMNYSMEDHQAVLAGKGRLVTPLTQQAGVSAPTTQPQETLAAAWSKSCTLHFSPQAGQGGAQDMAIERAELDGDVSVIHPQMNLASNALTVDFTPRSPALSSPTTAPSASLANAQGGVRDLTATGGVKCLMKDSTGKTQNIECERLMMVSAQTPDGRVYPRTVSADDKVHTFDGDQDLHAKHLTVTLAPPSAKTDAATQPATTQPAATSIPQVDLERLVAQDDVKVVTKDGAIATANQLFVTIADGKPQARLVGEPAKVVSKDGIVTGPVIDMFQKDQRAAITGAGTLHAVQQATPGATTRPMDVSWADGANVDGAKNQIDVNGKVVATSSQPDGAVDTAKAEHLRLILAEAPTTAPSTMPSTAPTTSGAGMSLAAGGMGMFSNKVVRSVILTDHADVNSVETAPTGTLLRRTHLLSDEIHFDTVDEKGNANRRVRVPVHGTMLYEDHRAPTTRPATSQANAMGDNRGATAFEWQKQLLYDEASHDATMTGDVVIVHKPENDDPAGAFRMNADEVVAELSPAPPSATRATTTASINDVRVELKRLKVRGALHFEARDLSFDADNVEYDPNTKILTARGSQHRPAHLFDEKGLSKGSFMQLRYNTQTGQVQTQDFIGEARPASQSPRKIYQQETP